MMDMDSMVDMKMPKKSKKEMMGQATVAGTDMPEYPWGLRLELSNEALKKLKGLKDGKVGDTVNIIATGRITSMRSESRQEGMDDQNMGIQIEKMNAKCDDSDYDDAFEKASKEK